MDGKTILVTGGAGFIGSELVRQLADAEAQVIAVDNLQNGKRENLSDVDPDRVRFEVVDIRDHDAMRPLMRDADIVLHLACLGVRHSIHSPLENHDVNATATLHLLQEAREAGTERFVYVSSSEVYGTAKFAPITLDHPTLPHTVYGASKLAGECYTRACHDTHGMDTVVVRPFNAYGPRSHHEGDSGEVIPKFMLRCMAGVPMVVFGDGRQTRDFTYVGDTARGIILAASHPDARGWTINLGSGREIGIKELASVIADVTGVEAPQIVHDDPRPGDVLRLLADTVPARELLGFHPSVGLREGLGILHEWYNQQEKSVAELLQEESQRNWEIEAA